MNSTSVVEELLSENIKEPGEYFVEKNPRLNTINIKVVIPRTVVEERVPIDMTDSRATPPEVIVGNFLDSIYDKLVKQIEDILGRSDQV